MANLSSILSGSYLGASGATSSSTISTTDVGTNGMQSFYLNVV